MELNTYGLTPRKTPIARVFDIQGWNMLVELAPNEDGEGIGHRIVVNTDIQGLEPLSIWAGSSDIADEDFDAMEADMQQRLADMTDEQAYRLLAGFFNTVGPMVKAMLEGE